MAGLIHNDQEDLAAQVASTITRTGAMGFLTDALVVAANTKEGLKDAIRSIAVHNDVEPIKLLLITALDKDPNITDANILNLTTVAGLVALTGVAATTGGDILE